jgi:hypothetical protein
MGFFGNLLGSGLGKLGENFLGKTDGIDGATLGGTLGNLLPFKTGGKVPGRKGKARVILAHSGEYVLPCGVNPTAFQKKEVAKRKKRASKKK